MKYQKFSIQLTLIENGKPMVLEPLTYKLERTEVIHNPFTGQRDVAMDCRCLETGEHYYTTERVCEDFENKGYLTVI